MPKKEFKGYPSISDYIITELLCGRKREELVKELIERGMEPRIAQTCVSVYIRRFEKKLKYVYQKI